MSDKLAKNIKRYRKEKNWTQAKLAKEANISLMSVRRYETVGDGNREPGFEVLDRIAEALDKTPDELRGVYDLRKRFKEIQDLVMNEDNKDKRMDLQIFASPLDTIDLSIIGKLNNKGKEKVLDYAADLVKIEEYLEKKEE